MPSGRCSDGGSPAKTPTKSDRTICGAPSLLRKLTPPMPKLPSICLDSRPMARAHKHGYLRCSWGTSTDQHVFVVLRSASIEWYEDEVTARTAGPNRGELPLVSKSVVHEESRPIAPPRKKGAAPAPDRSATTLLLRVVTRAQELQLEAESEASMREWLASIRERLVALGADPDNITPRAPPRSKKSTTPPQKQALLPPSTQRSDDARMTQARWLFAQEGQPDDDEEDDEEAPPPPPARGKASADKGGGLKAESSAAVEGYVSCLGGVLLVRSSHATVLAGLLFLLLLAESAYIVYKL